MNWILLLTSRSQSDLMQTFAEENPVEFATMCKEFNIDPETASIAVPLDNPPGGKDLLLRIQDHIDAKVRAMHKPNTNPTDVRWE